MGATNNPGTNGKYHRQASGRGRYCCNSAETPDGTGRRTIGHEGRTPEYMAPRGDQGERSRHLEVGKLVIITKVAFRDG